MEEKIYTFNYNGKTREYYIDEIEHGNDYILIPYLKGEHACSNSINNILYTLSYKFRVSDSKQDCIKALCCAIEKEPKKFFNIQRLDYVKLMKSK